MEIFLAIVIFACTVAVSVICIASGARDDEEFPLPSALPVFVGGTLLAMVVASMHWWPPIPW